MTEIKDFIDGLSEELSPIKEQAMKRYNTDSRIREDNVVLIGKQEWIAPQSFGLLLFPPVRKDWLIEFEKRTGKTIPASYETILLQINGCFVYDFSLFGLPASVYTTGLLNRGSLRQFDLTEANSSWIREYDIEQSLFHFGGRAYSYDENIGYFMAGETILSVRTSGEILNTYLNVADFLSTEIGIAEQMMIVKRDEYENIK